MMELMKILMLAMTPVDNTPAARQALCAGINPASMMLMTLMSIMKVIPW
jgi:hypothetical protein